MKKRNVWRMLGTWSRGVAWAAAWVTLLLSGAVANVQAATATAVFAGGCFWCLEANLKKLAGVVAVESGYTAGKTARPTYEEVSLEALVKSGRFKNIYTELTSAGVFYLAEENHQHYYKKNTVSYNCYRLSCGRDARLKMIWK